MNESENFSAGDFNVSSSLRKSFSSLLDAKRTLLLVPNNQSTAEGLLTLDSELIPVSTDINDKLRQSICSSSKLQFKRSVKSLQEFGAMPKHGNAITSCPENVDQICLNLRDDDVPS